MPHKPWIFLFAIFLCSFLLPTQARATYYLSFLSPIDSNSTVSQFLRGNAIAELHFVKSRNATNKERRTRLKIICHHNIDENVTRAWISHQNDSDREYMRMFISRTLDVVSLNKVLTVQQLADLQDEKLYISIASASLPKGSITGRIVSRPYQYATWPDNLVPTSNFTLVKEYNATRVFGYAVAAVTSPSSSDAKLPYDISDSSAQYFSSIRLQSIFIHTIISAFSADLGLGSPIAYNMAPRLALLGEGIIEPSSLSFFDEGSGNVSLYISIDLSSTILFGVFVPLLKPRPPILPIAITLPSGILSGDPRYMAKQELSGIEMNSTLAVNLIPGNNDILEANFRWNFPIARKNIRIIRGVNINLNIWGTGQRWLFQLFNQNTKKWTTIGTYDGSDQWTLTTLVIPGSDVTPFIDPELSSLVMRITSTGQQALVIDQLTVSAWLQNPAFTWKNRPNLFFY